MAPLDLRLGRRMQPTTRGRYLSVRGLLSDASSGVNVGFQKNEMEVFVMRWMELECVIQSEVSQKEKNKYSMLTHIYGI